MIPFASYSAHAGNSRQGHLTHLPQLSAGAPIDPAGRGVRGLSGWWKQGPLNPEGPYQSTICSQLESRLLLTPFTPTMSQSEGR